MKKINRSAYFGFGIIFAPKSAEYPAGIVINFMFWEFSHHWGFSQDEIDNLSLLEQKVKKAYGIK